MTTRSSHSHHRRNFIAILIASMSLFAVFPLSAEQIVLTVGRAYDVTGHIDGPDFWPLHNQADFFAKGKVATGSLLATGPIVGKDEVEFNWSVTTTVPRTTRLFPVHVELWDDDDPVATGDDNNVDINPVAGARNLDLVFDACTFKWTGSVPGNRAMVIATGAGDSDRAALSFNISTGDNRPFSPDDVAIWHAAPVQTAFDPEYIVADKKTSFRLDLSSSYSVPRTGIVTVTLRDGYGDTRTESRTVVVPPSGTIVYFFDGSAGVEPWSPPRNPNDPELCWDVTADFGAEGPPTGAPEGFKDCYGANNSVINACRRMIRTRNPVTRYQAWDWITPPGLLYPSGALVGLSFDSSERFRQAVYPIPASIGSIAPSRLATPYVPGPGLLLEPAATMALVSPMALLAGIDRLVLMPRPGWFSDNVPLSLWFSSNMNGISLGEYLSNVVIAEANISEVVSHEIGHTYRLSRRPCATGGIWETLLDIGCRDEYKHFPPNPAPYPANGFDVVGNIYPAGASPTVPGTREVNSFNFMGATGAPPGTYTRWIDDLNYNFLLRETDTTGTTTMPLRPDPDPELGRASQVSLQASSLVTVGGFINARNGILAEPPDFEGGLLSSYLFVPATDSATRFTEAPLNGMSGSGAFMIRLITSAGSRTYLFTPAFAPPEVEDLQDMTWFAFAVPWDDATTRIELRGPSSLQDPGQIQDVLLAAIDRSAAPPAITRLLAGLDQPPNLANPQPEPPTIPIGHTVGFSWDASDSDSPALKSILLLSSTDGGTQILTPMAMDLSNGSYTVPLAVTDDLAPGTYGVRVVTSDGVNTTAFEQASLFTICRTTNNGVETCDGLDNDCNGLLDDVPVPGAVPELAIDNTSLSWGSPQSPLDSFDIVRGDLVSLHGTGGDYAQSVSSCLAAKLPANTLSYSGAPLAGQGAWFLVRAAHCGARGTWDSGSQSQSGSSDGELALAPVTCPSCGHDRCVTGFPLSAGCDECVASICSQAPNCCTTGWDASCVQMINGVCGSQVCGQSAGQCPHTLCSEGGPLSGGCDVPPLPFSCVQQICQQHSSCCNGSWDATCVAEVATVCQLNCD